MNRYSCKDENSIAIFGLVSVWWVELDIPRGSNEKAIYIDTIGNVFVARCILLCFTELLSS